VSGSGTATLGRERARASRPSPGVPAWPAAAVAAAPFLVLLVWVVARFPGHAGVWAVGWAPGLGLELTFRADALSLTMLAVLGVVGAAVAVHAAHYASADRRTALLVLVLAFSASMAGLVTADHVLTLFVAWELTSVTSYLLIGFDDRRADARAAARQAFVTTGAGGLALLGGLLLLATEAGTWTLAGIVAAAPQGAAATAGLVLVLVGAATKSAQVPFHGWLPAASAAPAPVSALLHSATMVKAGIYLVARLAPGFAGDPAWRVLVLGTAAVTVVWAGWRALAQTDLKRLLAFSTAAQLGLLMLVLGTGSPKALSAGIALLVAHAAAKASLFLGTGALEKLVGTRDLDALRGVGRRHTLVAAAMTAAAVSMSGLPPALGYAAKEAGLAAVLASGQGWAVAAMVVGSAFTVAYAARLVLALWRAPAPGGAVTGGKVAGGRAAGLVGPTAFLAVVPVLAAVWLSSASAAAAAAAAALVPDAPSVLVWWPGLVPALGWSLVAVLAGLAGLALGERRGWPRDRAPWISTRTVLDAVEAVAVAVTTRVQSGSLPAYLAVLVAVAVAVPAAGWLAGGAPLPRVPAAAGAAEVVLAAATIASAVGVLRSSSRFGAVLALGGVGYAMTGLFVLRSAPDLALTQAVIETVTLLAFALVLGRVPTRPGGAPNALPPVLRGVLAAGVAALAGVVSLVGGAGVDAPDGIGAAARSIESTGAANVVNGILTDLRALDTLGEVVVLAVAALGVLALARPLAGAGRTRGDAVRSEDGEVRP
jgi:multicomponent Na+:H+ antiporter subunit A